MKFAYTCTCAREADARAEKNGAPAEELMLRAGKALAGAVSAAMERCGAGEALFVCGGGNNGGDGFVAARLLAESGEEVAVLCLAERFSADCAREKARFGGEIFSRIPRRRYAVIADCVLGTGISRAPEGETASLIEYINASGAYVISCDLPSGLGEGGIAFSPCVYADETVTMGCLKQSLLLADGADVSGEITVADIGIAPVGRGAEVWEEGDVKAIFPPKKSHTHKGNYGSACILAGGAYSGAAFLSAGACLKSGAGYTRLCVSEELFPAAVGKLPACILRAFRAIDGEILASDCIALGMGTGVSERLYAIAAELIGSYTGTLLLDADALNTLSEFGADILRKKSCNVVVTPHPKEFSRLCGKSVGELLRGAVGCAEEFAREYGVTVVLKNNRTVVTDGERTAIVTSGSPALAKGGSGDVLSGFLAGTIARGVDAFTAACGASYVLGKAGEEAEAELGEYAPDASDIISYLPRVMKRLQQPRRMGAPFRTPTTVRLR